MARRSKSNCRSNNGAVRFLPLALAVLLAAGGCASGDGGHMVGGTAGPATPHLDALRDYLEKPPGLRPAAQEALRAAAEEGGNTERLQYALALSTHLDDPDALIRAREHFEALLAAPEPLPVALDGLVRLQLASIIDRIQRLEENAALRAARRSCHDERQRCESELLSAHEELAANRDELENLRRKLAALTRIEQSVNEGADERNRRRRINGDDHPEGNNAPVPTDSSGR